MSSTRPHSSAAQADAIPPVRVLICDDSPFMRRSMQGALDLDARIDVVGTAATGRQAIELCRVLQPDVLTLDLELPGIDGVAVLEAIRSLDIRVLVVSSATGTSTTERAIEVLAAGALDVLGKPSGDLGRSEFQLRLAQSVCDIASGTGRHVRLKPPAPLLSMPDRSDATSRGRLIVIGASTGGPSAIDLLLSSLPPDFSSPIIVVQHMPRGFTDPFARRLQRSCPLHVVEATDGAMIEPGTVLVARSGAHLHIGRDQVWLRAGDPLHGMCPAVDIALADAAATWGDRMTAVILTGIGVDGRAGAMQARQAGGRVLVEDQSSCAVYGMPRAVIEAGAADVIAPLAALPALLVEEAMR